MYRVYYFQKNILNVFDLSGYFIAREEDIKKLYNKDLLIDFTDVQEHEEIIIDEGDFVDVTERILSINNKYYIEFKYVHEYKEEDKGKIKTDYLDIISISGFNPFNYLQINS